MILIVMAISAAFSWCKHPKSPSLSFFSFSPSHTHTLTNSHTLISHVQKIKKLYKHNFAIKTFIIAKICTACTLHSHDNRATCSVPIISCPCIQMYLNERCLDPLCAGKTVHRRESRAKKGRRCPTCICSHDFEDVTPLSPPQSKQLLNLQLKRWLHITMPPQRPPPPLPLIWRLTVNFWAAPKCSHFNWSLQSYANVAGRWGDIFQR